MCGHLLKSWFYVVPQVLPGMFQNEEYTSSIRLRKLGGLPDDNHCP